MITSAPVEHYTQPKKLSINFKINPFQKRLDGPQAIALFLTSKPSMVHEAIPGNQARLASARMSVQEFLL